MTRSVAGESEKKESNFKVYLASAAIEAPRKRCRKSEALSVFTSQWNTIKCSIKFQNVLDSFLALL